MWVMALRVRTCAYRFPQKWILEELVYICINFMQFTVETTVSLICCRKNSSFWSNLCVCVA